MQISLVRDFTYKKVFTFFFELPYATFLLWPAICFYYSIFCYQPYEIFLIRLPLYILINLLVYGIAFLLTGSKEKAVLGILVFFFTKLLFTRFGANLPMLHEIRNFWHIHPEALLIPFAILPLLRLIKVSHGLIKFIHMFTFIWIVLMHLRLGARWVTNRYYRQIPPPQACPAPEIQDTLRTYPDIYCLVFDAFGHPDTLRRYTGLRLSFTDSLSKRGFISSSLSLPYIRTLAAMYNLFSPHSPLASPSELEARILQEHDYAIFAHVYLPAILRERGYYVRGPVSLFFPLQNIPCLEFYNYANIFDWTFPYNSRWSNFFWNKLNILYRNWSSHPNMPTFHYYHVYTSHSPYVYDTNGHYIRAAKDSFNSWRASFYYTEKVLLQLIKEIQGSRQSNSRPYAILIFSDHGPRVNFYDYAVAPDTVDIILHSAWAALYTSWPLPDSTRRAFLQSTHHQHLGQVILKIANPI